MGAGTLAVLVVVAVAGCVHSQATACGELLCPEGRACARGQCVDQSLVTACDRVGEGASCMLPEIGEGTCSAGLCLVGACGDGIINAIDACDGDNLDGKTCLDFGATDPAGLKCAADCSFDKSGCTARCGDGTKGMAEECDGTDFGGQTCITAGFYAGALVCTGDCTINTGGCAGRCGDGVLNGFAEECDGVDFGGDSCAARGHPGDVVPLMCTTGCAYDPSSCTCGGELCPASAPRCVRVDDIFTCEAM